MTYVLHRKRQVAKSIFEDMRLRLGNRGWLDPAMPLLEASPLVPIPAFPDDVQGEGTAMNTIAVNNGEADEVEAEEMGGNFWSQQYTFHFAFYAVSDAAGDALFQDLHDEWVQDFIPLYDYTQSPAPRVTMMEVLSFEWTQANDQLMTVAQRRLHFGRLVLLDYIDELRPAS